MQTAIAEPVVNYARCSRRPRRRRHQHPTKCPHFKYYARPRQSLTWTVYVCR